MGRLPEGVAHPHNAGSRSRGRRKKTKMPDEDARGAPHIIAKQSADRCHELTPDLFYTPVKARDQ